jgi:hypothetical protein
MATSNLRFLTRSLTALSLAPASLLLVNSLGCNRTPTPPLPTTYPATGQVVDKSGKPVTIGTIEFVSAVDGKTDAVGKLQADGTFSLITVVGKEMVSGAVEGAHKVTFLPGSQEQVPVYFKETCKVVPGANHFKLTYP